MPLNDDAINEILPFAAGVAAPNVQPLAEYKLDPARLGGNASGLARSAFMNRTWRQAAHMAAGLAQFIANRHPAGVHDDGNLDAVEEGIASAIASLRTAAEEFRLSWIGVPRPWRSTTLPANHIWATGDLVLFEDWPELAEVHASGGFGGMLLEADADDALTATYPGRWKKHSQGVGLYAPILGGQFLRAWSQGQSMDADREAGARQGDAIRNITGSMELHYNLIASTSGALTLGSTGPTVYATGSSPLTGSLFAYLDASRVVPTASEVRPYNTAVPMIIYLGQAAGV